jgi:hypothetical protein
VVGHSVCHAVDLAVRHGALVMTPGRPRYMRRRRASLQQPKGRSQPKVQWEIGWTSVTLAPWMGRHDRNAMIDRAAGVD